MVYTYDCPKCGKVTLFRPVKDYRETVCDCGTVVSRTQGDFSTNLELPFKPVRLFGVGGRNGTVVNSKSEMRRVLHHGWDGDYDYGNDRVAVTPDEVDKMFGFDSRIPKTK